MALAVATNLGDTSVTPTQIQKIDWSTWNTVSQNANSVTLDNTAAGFTTPNRVRIERSNIGNIYTGTGIVANYQLPTKEGVKLFFQSTSTFAMTDSTDPTFLVYLPYSASLTLRVPKVPVAYVTYANIARVMRQIMAAWLPSNKSTNTLEASVQADAIGRLLSGSINPVNWPEYTGPTGS